MNKELNIEVGECVIESPHDFQIEGFMKLLNHIIFVDKEVLKYQLEMVEMRCELEDEYSQEDKEGYREFLDRKLCDIGSLWIYNSTYVFDVDGKVKLLIEYVCSKEFTDVEEMLQQCINKVYSIYSLEQKYRKVRI